MAALLVRGPQQAEEGGTLLLVSLHFSFEESEG